MTDYNYDTFSSDDYDFDTSAGPQVGSKAPDFELRTSDGRTRRLLDFEGDFLVLELGSITCPLFQSRRGIMSGLTGSRDGVESVVLYVREAHPGAQIPAHRSDADKVACARRLTEDDGETRTVFVDTLEGSAHRAYGGMPNAVYIINRNGCVVFKSDWNNPSATRAALDDLRAGRPVRSRSFFRPPLPPVAVGTLRRAGRGSASDFFRSLPWLIWHNLIRRNLRLLFGRATRAGGPDMAC